MFCGDALTHLGMVSSEHDRLVRQDCVNLVECINDLGSICTILFSLEILSSQS